MKLKLWQRNALIVICFLILMMFVGRIMSSPQHGKPVKSDRTRIKELAKPQTKVTPASDDDQQYFSLALPTGFIQQASQHPGGRILFAQTIIKPADFGSIIINVGIQTAPEGGIEADSSYNLRRTQTDRYTITMATFDGEPVAITSDLQSASVVAFWMHGQYMATISVSQGIGNASSDNNSDIIKVLSTLLGGWNWK